jgi:hypothetical protein
MMLSKLTPCPSRLWVHVILNKHVLDSRPSAVGGIDLGQALSSLLVYSSTKEPKVDILVADAQSVPYLGISIK